MKFVTTTMGRLLAISPSITPATFSTHKHELRPSPSTRRGSYHPVAPSILLSRSRPSASPKPLQTLRHPRRDKLPPDPVTSGPPFKIGGGQDPHPLDGTVVGDKEERGPELSADNDSVWSPEELESISALFERPMPQKLAKPVRDRPLPPLSPHKTRLPGFPSPKRHVRSASRAAIAPRSSFADRVRKNPEALVGIAREIAALAPNQDAGEVLDRWSRFLRKGSLSMTVRELGHMGLPERALQTLCWAQRQPSLFPDDRILASTVQVLARYGQLRVELEKENYLNSASRAVLEAMALGFIASGRLHRARKTLLFAKDNKRTLGAGIYAKLILEAGRTPDGYRLAAAVLDELGEREDFDLEPQDCTAVMKVCIKLGRFEAVENLFHWYKHTGRSPTVVMYTTVIHGRLCAKNCREALALVWEMESSGCPLDLPAYRVVIKLLVALNDLARAARYFSKLKDAGFSPTYDIYRDMIKVYAASGRLAKCRQVQNEAELVGLRLDEKTVSLLSELESKDSA